MPVYALSDAILFPPPTHAEPDGLLAVGGDLSPQRLLAAYSSGIFPWYSEGDPILWYCTHPRPVLFPDELHIPGSLKPILNRPKWRVTVDTSFSAVIRECSAAGRPGQNGTWILPEMQEAYIRLHESGYAHSVEVWDDEQLIGGVYGLSLGRTFFGESMFAKVPDASKYGFVIFVRQLSKLGFDMIDCQQSTPHLMRFGAREIPLTSFLSLLRDSLEKPTIRGIWSEMFKFPNPVR